MPKNLYALNDAPIYKITQNLFLLTKFKVFGNSYKMLAFWFPTRNSWDTLAWKRRTERFYRKGYTCLSSLKEVTLMVIHGSTRSDDKYFRKG